MALVLRTLQYIFHVAEESSDDQRINHHLCVGEVVALWVVRV